MRNCLLFVLLATTAQADTPLSAEKLDAITLGNSYVISRLGGDPYGITVFHPNRTVTWHYFGRDCKIGSWAEPEPGLICFTYPATYPCWHFFRDGDSLRMNFNGDPDEPYVYGPPGSIVSPCDAPQLG